MPARRKAPNAFDPFGLDIERMFGPDHLKHDDAIEVASLYPALLSGLACAGTNNPPRSLVAGSLDVGDGVLTALEVAGLDLTGCRLAVLSACRTGLGNVAGAQGCWVCNGPSTRRVWLPWSPASGTSTTRPPPFSWRNSTPTSGVKNCHHSWLCGGQLTVLNRPERVLERRLEFVAASDPRGLAERSEPLPPGQTSTRRSPPGWWAGFVLSGEIGSDIH